MSSLFCMNKTQACSLPDLNQPIMSLDNGARYEWHANRSFNWHVVQLHLLSCDNNRNSVEWENVCRHWCQFWLYWYYSKNKLKQHVLLVFFSNFSLYLFVGYVPEKEQSFENPQWSTGVFYWGQEREYNQHMLSPKPVIPFGVNYMSIMTYIC